MRTIEKTDKSIGCRYGRPIFTIKKHYLKLDPMVACLYDKECTSKCNTEHRKGVCKPTRRD